MQTATAPLDVERVRADFPILSREVHGRPLVYLDNAATTQKPLAVLDRLARYYRDENANVHRGVHFLSAEGTENYEAARQSVQQFIGAEHAREVVFTRGTTESINLVASGFERGGFLASGDEILISGLEHHANIVPWQMAAERTGATLRVIPITDAGDLDLAGLDTLLNERTRIVAVTHTSNALGTVTPLAEIVEAARQRQIPVLVDGAQATPHAPVDVQALGADFFVFSGHKTFGPTGIGVLWGREAWLEKLPPYQGGGDMIDEVTFEKTTYAGLPARFEAGTPHVAGGIGLGAAVEYLMSLGMESVAAHESDVIAYAEAKTGRDRRAHVRRHARAPRQRRLVPPRRHPPVRRRDDPRPPRHRRPHRPALRAARHGPPRRARHPPRLVRPLQHPRRSRCPRGRAGAGPRDVRLASGDSMTDLDTRQQEIADEFAFLDDWMLRYQHLIEHAKTMEPLAPEARDRRPARARLPVARVAAYVARGRPLPHRGRLRGADRPRAWPHSSSACSTGSRQRPSRVPTCGACARRGSPSTSRLTARTGSTRWCGAFAPRRRQRRPRLWRQRRPHGVRQKPT